MGNKEVKFTFSLVPSDIKWLASFSSEKMNSGYYFSSFADVCQADKSTMNGSLGTMRLCKRIKNAKAVKKFKTTFIKAKFPSRYKVLN